MGDSPHWAGFPSHTVSSRRPRLRAALGQAFCPAAQRPLHSGHPGQGRPQRDGRTKREEAARPTRAAGPETASVPNRPRCLLFSATFAVTATEVLAALTRLKAATRLGSVCRAQALLRTCSRNQIARPCETAPLCAPRVVCPSVTIIRCQGFSINFPKSI